MRAARLAKGVWLSAGDGIAWNDNMLDVLPGDPQIITARGLGDRPVEAQWLGMSGHRAPAADYGLFNIAHSARKGRMTSMKRSNWSRRML